MGIRKYTTAEGEPEVVETEMVEDTKTPVPPEKSPL